MLKVGLTGSIAVGKSFVLQLLSELGCHVLDADEIAREVVRPGSAGLQAVVDSFGAEILKSDGTLDRERLGSIIFADEEKRLLLNSVLHPFIIAAQDEELQRLERRDPKGIAVIDAALMIESGGYKRFDKLIVVHCRPEIQLERLMTRDKLSREDARRRINSQMAQDEKKKYADFLIDTSGPFASTSAQVESLFRELKEFAAAA